MANDYYIYADASYNKQHQLAVAGYFIFNNSETHHDGLTSLSIIYTLQFKEINNIRAELRGALAALDALGVQLQSHVDAKTKNNFTITLFTDCRAIAQLLGRRKKLEAAAYISQNKKTVLNNADLYRLFFLSYDRFKFNVVWLKGHSAEKNQTMLHKNFSFIDKTVRKELRRTIG